MKRAVVLLLVLVDIISCASLAKDVSGIEKQHRWEMVPDSEGLMHLVDFDPLDVSIEPAFNAEVDMVFLLFTRRNPTVGQVIRLNNLQSVQNSNFNPTHPTRFTIHGWNGNADSSVNRLSRDAFLRQGQYNIITVNWTVGATSSNYITARNRVGAAGQVTARFIDFLHANNFIRFNDIHVIGHSLGAHVSGIAGKRVTRGRIQVVNGLDPAGPLFSLNAPTERMARTDGVYVEVMHTNGGVQGFREPIGLADFFPNFGRSQPGCGVDVTGACAHERTVPLYAESINTVFTGQGCQTFEQIDNNQCTRTGRTARMGGPLGSVGANGFFHLTTNAASPFSRG